MARLVPGSQIEIIEDVEHILHLEDPTSIGNQSSPTSAGSAERRRRPESSGGSAKIQVPAALVKAGYMVQIDVRFSIRSLCTSQHPLRVRAGVGRVHAVLLGVTASSSAIWIFWPKEDLEQPISGQFVKNAAIS